MSKKTAGFWVDRIPEMIFLVVIAVCAAAILLPSHLHQKTNNSAADDGPAAAGPPLAIYDPSAASAKPAASSTSGAAQPVISPTPAASKYVAPVCHTVSVPYKTTYVNVSYLDIGQREEYGGVDGSRYVCTPDDKSYEWAIAPIDKTVYVGTGSPVTPPPASQPSANSSGYTYAEAYSLAYHNCQAILSQYNATASSAMQSCVQAGLRNYGY